MNKKRRLELTEKAVRNWRGWAQFVYLGGGKPSGTDAELQQRVCEAHDREVREARQAAAAVDPHASDPLGPTTRA